MNFKSLALGASIALVGAMSFASPAEARPRCGQYETRQERQICRGLRDGIRREIREERRYHGHRWQGGHRYHGYRDYRSTEQKVRDGIREGLNHILR